jgi:superfamily I DNA/RNA helicase
MPEDTGFTTAQLALIEGSTDLYVEACPGAGKTHAIVQRYLERPVHHPRKGVALLSFTNVAADEARRRAAGRPDLLHVPNFIGTIDAFINRFVVAPSMLAERGISPVFRDSWALVAGTTIDAGGRVKPSLDAFVIEKGVAVLDVERLPWRERAAAAEMTDWQRQRLETLAFARWNSLIASGVVAASASRVLLGQYLDDTHLRQTLSQLLEDRFCEAILDEAQDCSEEDVLLLSLLRDSGVGVVAVGDPDQAIYGFRTQSPEHLPELLESLESGERLDGNFRSSPAICSLVDSLRDRTGTDTAVGPNSAETTPVLLTSYQRVHELPGRLTELANDRGIPVEAVIVLAHAENTACASAGGGKEYKIGRSKLARMAAAFHQLADESISPAIRSRALTDMGSLLRELGETELGHDAYLSQMGLTDREFRDACLRLAMAASDPYSGPPSAFKAALCAARESQQLLHWKTQGLRNLPKDTWPELPSSATSTLPYSTVHAFKGLQRDCVALVIPKSRRDESVDGVAQWANELPGESRRVLYVGASRAKKVLILAVHGSRYDLVRTTLDRDSVPYEEASQGTR